VHLENNMVVLFSRGEVCGERAVCNKERDAESSPRSVRGLEKGLQEYGLVLIHDDEYPFCIRL